MTTLTRSTLKASTSLIATMTYNQPQLVNDLAEILCPYLMVIDNGSVPALAAPTKLAYDVLRVPENRYFAGGWNYAMPSLRAKWVVMLNDDITGISLEMIDALIDRAEDADYAAISPAFNSPHVHMQPKGEGLHRVASIDWVAAIVRKDAWDAVGGFDAVNFPGYGCDLDIAYKFKQLGYRLAVDDSWVIHHAGGTAAILGGTQGIQGNVVGMNAAFQRLYGVGDWVEFTQKFL